MGCLYLSKIATFAFLIQFTAAVAASTSCHQRALSLPCAAAVLNAAPSSSSVTASASSKVSGIQPVHQRTRSLPLTEETAIVVPMPRPESRVVNCSCPTDGAPNSLCTHRIPHGATPVGVDGGHLNNNHLPPAGCPGGNCPEMNNNRDHQLILHHHLHHHHQMSTTSMESIVEDQALASEASEEKIVKNLAPRKISTGKFPGASASFSGGSPLLIRRARNSNSTRSTYLKCTLPRSPILYIYLHKFFLLKNKKKFHRKLCVCVCECLRKVCVSPESLVFRVLQSLCQRC